MRRLEALCFLVRTREQRASRFEGRRKRAFVLKKRIWRRLVPMGFHNWRHLVFPA